MQLTAFFLSFFLGEWRRDDARMNATAHTQRTTRTPILAVAATKLTARALALDSRARRAGVFGAERFYLGELAGAIVKLVLTFCFCIVNIIVRCCFTEDDDKAVLKAALICTFACAVNLWWLCDWIMILTNELQPVDGPYKTFFVTYGST